MNDSKKFSLNFKDFVGVGKNAVLVGFAAGLTYVANNLGVVDLGIYGPLIVPIVAAGLDVAIKWAKDNQSK